MIIWFLRILTETNLNKKSYVEGIIHSKFGIAEFWMIYQLETSNIIRMVAANPDHLYILSKSFAKRSGVFRQYEMHQHIVKLGDRYS